VINVIGNTDTTAPTASVYPANGAANVYHDAVVKVHFSEPITGLSPSSFTLVNAQGLSVPAYVDQIGDGTWALFPHSVFLAGRTTYTARVTGPVCDLNGNCTSQPIVWSFTTARNAADGVGNTSVPLGFPANGGGGNPAPTVTNVNPANGATNVLRSSNVIITFSEAVTNVTDQTLLVNQAGGTGKNCNTLGAAVAGAISGNGAQTVWTFDPALTLGSRLLYCVTVTTGVRDATNQPMAAPFRSSFKTGGT
jgi:hypothetical protein